MIGGSRFCHHILPRVWERAFARRREDAVDPNEDDFHSHCHKKVLSSLDSVQSDDFMKSIGLCLVADPPVSSLAPPGLPHGSHQSGFLFFIF